jgi:hypothetical protein
LGNNDDGTPFRIKRRLNLSHVAMNEFAIADSLFLTQPLVSFQKTVLLQNDSN